jgi:pre-mRNA-splicing factor SYF1
MPRIWLDYCEFLMEQKKISSTRHAFDRALRSLAVTQHDRIWKLFIKFARMPYVPVQTALRIHYRYLKVIITPPLAKLNLQFTCSGNQDILKSLSII